MSKAKKAVEEEVKHKATEKLEIDEDHEDLVSVEMTEAEKDEFVAFKKEQKKKKEEEQKPEEQVQINLRYQHRINGVKYGPGVTTGSLGMITYLKGQDDRHFADRLRETQSDNHMIVMAMSGERKIIKVKDAGL